MRGVVQDQTKRNSSRNRILFFAGTPLLLIRATTLDQDGRRVEVSDGAFLGERYRFRTSVTAGAASVEPVSR